MLPLVTFVAVLTALSNVSAYFVSIQPIITARMDPIVNPGVVSSHVHQIYGANNFRSVLNKPTELLNADCTSASIKVDNSNYWVAHVYFINDDGKFEALQSTGGRVYYHRTNEDWTSPFPQGFRMLAGNAMNRDVYQPQMAATALGYSCDGVSPGGVRAYLPNGTHFPNGCSQISQTITFPSCGWANQTLDVPNHQDHVAYPISTGGGKVWLDPFHGKECPPSHPVKYPNIHLEVYYVLSARQKAMWGNKKRVNRLVLSNGDLLGSTNHGDFVMGWEPKAFADSLKGCANAPGGDANKCGVFAGKGSDSDYGRNCRFAGMIPDEEVGYARPLDRLPGCNPLWDRNAGNQKPACSGAVNPGWVAPNAIFQNQRRYPIPVAFDFGTTPVRDYKPVAYGTEGWFEPYNDQTYCCGVVAPNLGKWFTSTLAEVRANKNMATAPNKIDKVYNQKDSSKYTDTRPPQPVSNKHHTINYKITTNWIPNGVGNTPPTNYPGLLKPSAVKRSQRKRMGKGGE